MSEVQHHDAPHATPTLAETLSREAKATTEHATDD